MDPVVIVAIVSAAVGVLSSSLGVIWSAIRSEREKKAAEQRVKTEQPGQVDVRLSGGRSMTINIGSATPEELVTFIEGIKSQKQSAEVNPDRIAES